jgi:hypothetical protein
MLGVDAPLPVTWSRIDGNANTQDSASTMVHTETVFSRTPPFVTAIEGSAATAGAAIDELFCPLPERTPWFRFTRGMAR